MCGDAMAKPKHKKQDQEEASIMPTLPTTSTRQAQAVSVSQNVLLGMLQLFHNEGEQMRQEDEVRRQAKEQCLKSFCGSQSTAITASADAWRKW